MARTKQTARKSSGGKAPRAIPMPQPPQQAQQQLYRAPPPAARAVAREFDYDSAKEICEHISESSQDSTDQIRFSVKSFGEILSDLCVKENPPCEAIVTSLTIDAKAIPHQDEFATADFVFLVEVLKGKAWVSVPLLTVELAVESFSAFPLGDGEKEKEKDKEKQKEDSKVRRGRSKVKDTESGKEEEEEGKEEKEKKEIGAHLYASKGYYHLAVRGTDCGVSKWEVRISTSCPFSSQRKNSFNFGICEAVSTNLRALVAQTSREDELLLKVEPALASEEYIVTPDSGDTEKTVYAEAIARCPPTGYLHVSWTPKLGADQEEEAEVEKEKQPLVVTATQEALWSIGEGLVSGEIMFQLQILHGSRALFEIELPESPPVRITNVIGNAIKKWEVVHKSPKDSIDFDESSSSSSSSSSIASGGPSSRRRLRVHHQYGAEGEYNLTLVCETDLKGVDEKAEEGEEESKKDKTPHTTGHAHIPCFQLSGVERETGYISIEARTNVEVQERSRFGCTRVDNTEITGSLRSRAANAILHSYKFLTPNYGIHMAVTRHDDVEVLVATIDEAWMVITAADGGNQVSRHLNRLHLLVRNTHTQFLRVTLPPGANVWSTMVKGRVVKPARDKSQRLMVPLEKAGGASDAAFGVQVVYTTTPGGSMQGRGSLEFTVPQFDLPMNSFCLTVFLPKSFEYGEFYGDLKEVKYLSRTKSNILQREDDANRQRTDQPNFEENFEMLPQQSNVRYNVQQQQQPQLSNVMSMPVAKSSTRGVRPIQTTALEVGKPFYFERLLVDGEQFHLSVPFREVKKSYFQQRRINTFSSSIFYVFVIIMLVLIWYFLNDLWSLFF